MSKSAKMDLAIFWLPLIAGIVLGGIAGNAWYGGDKTFALWVGFVGVLCLLLTGAIQVQQYILKTSDQPKLVFVGPQEKTSFRWEVADRAYWMAFGPERLALTRGTWTVPTIIVKNESRLFAQDASVTWDANPFDVERLVKESPRLAQYSITVANSKVRIDSANKDVSSWTTGLARSQSYQIPFITREVPAPIPLHVFNNALVYFLATLGEQTGDRSNPFIFEGTLRWNIPEGGKPVRVRVKAIATNTRVAGEGQPLFQASIEYETSVIETN